MDASEAQRDADVAERHAAAAVTLPSLTLPAPRKPRATERGALTDRWWHGAGRRMRVLVPIEDRTRSWLCEVNSPTVQTSAEQHSGTLASWPAGLRHRSSDAEQELPGQHSKPANGCTSTKPRFLRELEDFLQQDLARQRRDGAASGAQLLSSYSRCFDIFLHQFRTYRPLLSSIKAAYEKQLAGAREDCSKLTQEAQELRLAAAQAEVTIAAHRKDSEEAVAQIQRRLEESEHRRKEQQRQLKDAEARAAVLVHDREEALCQVAEMRMSNDILVSALRRHEEAAEEKRHQDLSLRKDHAMLKSTNAKLVRELKDAMDQVRVLSDLHRHMVTSEEAEELKGRAAEMEHFAHETNKQLQELKAAHAEILTERDRLRMELDDAQRQCAQHAALEERAARLERAATPRPRWKTVLNNANIHMDSTVCGARGRARLVQVQRTDRCPCAARHRRD